MLKLLKLELIKAIKPSTFILLILIIQQSLGSYLFELDYMGEVENIYQFIYTQIFLEKIMFFVYNSIAILTAYLISVELQEKSLQSQIAFGLSRISYFKAKMGFFFIVGILLIILMVAVHSLLIYFHLGFSYKWIVFINLKDTIIALINIFPFISIGLIIGLYAKPVAAIGIILLILILERSIKFFDSFFWEMGVKNFFPITVLANFTNDTFFLVLKFVYMLILIIVARHLIKTKDFV